MTMPPVTPPERNGFGPGFAQALDRYDVPPASDAFLARVSQIAEAVPVSGSRRSLISSWQPPFRGRGRGPWVRRTAIGLIAAGLVSATAAAAGMFEAVRFEIPMIARLLAPAEPAPAVAKVARPRPRATVSAPAVPGAATPVAEATAVAAIRAARLEQFRSLPMPVRAVMAERAAIRIQRRLAARGVLVPRRAILVRLAARTGQTDLPIGSPDERRAQFRAALIAAPPGALPPRLERLRARAIQLDPAAAAAGTAMPDNASISSPSSLTTAPSVARAASASKRAAPDAPMGGDRQADAPKGASVETMAAVADRTAATAPGAAAPMPQSMQEWRQLRRERWRRYWLAQQIRQEQVVGQAVPNQPAPNSKSDPQPK